MAASISTFHHKPPADTQVIVGLSGGVDSSVAALRLVEAGYQVEGLFMFNWSEDEAGRCQAADDFDDAATVCDALAIPLHRADFSREYKARVFQYFLDGYAAGRTPNPDVLCNREIKFDAFLHHAERLGADAIATGHYARLEHGRSSSRLLRGRDPARINPISWPRYPWLRWNARCSRWVKPTRPTCAAKRAPPACRSTTSPTAPACASSASAISRAFCASICPVAPGRYAYPAAQWTGARSANMRD